MFRDRFVFGLALFGALTVLPSAMAQTPAAAPATPAAPVMAGPAETTMAISHTGLGRHGSLGMTTGLSRTG